MFPLGCPGRNIIELFSGLSSSLLLEYLVTFESVKHSGRFTTIIYCLVSISRRLVSAQMFPWQLNTPVFVAVLIYEYENKFRTLETNSLNNYMHSMRQAMYILHLWPCKVEYCFVLFVFVSSLVQWSEHNNFLILESRAIKEAINNWKMYWAFEVASILRISNWKGHWYRFLNKEGIKVLE